MVIFTFAVACALPAAVLALAAEVTVAAIRWSSASVHTLPGSTHW